MLCLQDLSLNLFILGFCSRLGFYPFRICPKHGKIEDDTRIGKKIVYNFHQMVTTLHLIFTTSRFIQAVVNYQSEKGDSDLHLEIHHFGCAFICSSASFAVRSLSYTLFEKNRELFCSMFNEVVKHYTGTIIFGKRLLVR